MTSFRRSPRESRPLDDFYATAALPKGQKSERGDTSDLGQPKIHPLRDRAYLDWLKRRPCSIAGLIDGATAQPHVCWSPSEWARGVFVSDPAHCGKAYSGKLKRTDAEALSLCRHAHRLQEDNMNAFDQRFGIDRFEIASRQYAEYCGQKGERR